eukprot:Nitzschia sp. Nitz4//scaffold13_size275219//189801//191807//NITZ4_000894-RA/size275219-processed-gene-0.100-mRNA-1//1//CDS//3329536074//6669//frame0
MNPLQGLENTVGKEILEEIQTCKLLVVGSGGIGCELLKDLALSGFRHVEVIDLDTIDVSNLNRQLLFRSQHVGMAKCTVACQVATDMVPPVAEGSSLAPVVYLAHHGNVCDNSKFNVQFVKGFALVLNALDNVEARRRVNRLCLAAQVPLVEAGTTGYLGQVTVIHGPSQIECYECKTQETQKVYPICTIRSTPSMPVHTIVWAKELYKLLFHSQVKDSMLYEDPAGEEPSTYMESVSAIREALKASSGDMTSLISTLLEKLFVTEIQKQLDMGRYKAAKKTPTVLDAAILKEGVSLADAGSGLPSSETWSIPQCIAQFRECVQWAAQEGQTVLEVFDKDDDMAMRFVCAASNLRSSVFGIEPLQSLYSAKGIAGNIIPAIATTNAICAGLQILQCFRILEEQLKLKKSGGSAGDLVLRESCSYVSCLRNKTRNGLYLTASTLEAPNPNCFVCRNATIPLTLNVNEWTLELLLQKIVKAKLGFEAPTVLIDGDFVWEEGEGADSAEFEPNLSKVLSKLPCGGIQHGTVFELDDATQDLTIQVSVTHQEQWDVEDTGDLPFLVGGTPPKPKEEAPEKSAASTEEAPAVAAKASGGDDIVLVIDDDEDEGPAAGDKRFAEDELGPPTKKARATEPDVIAIE